MKIKDSLKNFRLSNIALLFCGVAWFFSGVVITVFLNWIVFKDPKMITADWVSALSSILTLLLASWSAFKVNKWLNSKVNETAYKQTEKILESISKIHFSSRKILENCKLIPDDYFFRRTSDISHTATENTYERLHDKLKSIEKHTQICSEMSLQLQILTYELPMWNIRLKNQQIKYKILNIIASTETLIEHCNKIKKHTNLKNQNYAIIKANEIVEDFHPILVGHINSIVTKQYQEIFEQVT